MFAKQLLHLSKTPLVCWRKLWLGIQDSFWESASTWESAGTLGFGGTGCKFSTEDCSEGVSEGEQPTPDFLSKLQLEMKNFVAKHITSMWKSPGRDLDPSQLQGTLVPAVVCALLFPSRTLASVICHSLCSLGKNTQKKHFVPWEKAVGEEKQRNLIFQADTYSGNSVYSVIYTG